MWNAVLACYISYNDVFWVACQIVGRRFWRQFLPVDPHECDVFQAVGFYKLCWFLCLRNLEVSSIFVCLYHSVSQPECVCKQCCWLLQDGILPTRLKLRLASDCWGCYVMRCILRCSVNLWRLLFCCLETWSSSFSQTYGLQSVQVIVSNKRSCAKC